MPYLILWVITVIGLTACDVNTQDLRDGKQLAAVVDESSSDTKKKKGKGKKGDDDDDDDDQTDDLIDRGLALYDANCASCHKPVAESTKLNSSVEEIAAAIEDVAVMRGLSSLKDDELEAIAFVLETPGDMDDPDAGLDGIGLYEKHCAGCHQTFSDTTKPRRGLDALNAAIDTVPEMASLSDMSESVRTLIADALLAIPDSTGGGDNVDPLARGVALYESFCQSCHGELAQSAVRGRPVADITAAIASVAQMAPLAGLTAEELDAIALATSDATTAAPIAQPRMAERRLLTNRFMRIFGIPGNNAHQSALTTIVSNEVTTRLDIFGGNCVRQDFNCPGNTTLSVQADAAAMPVPGPLRRGNLKRACSRIASVDANVLQVLARANVNTADDLTLERVEAIRAWFFREWPSNAALQSALLNVATQAEAAGATGLDRWRPVVLTLCQSTLMEVP